MYGKFSTNHKNNINIFVKKIASSAFVPAVNIKLDFYGRVSSHQKKIREATVSVLNDEMLVEDFALFFPFDMGGSSRFQQALH